MILCVLFSRGHKRRSQNYSAVLANALDPVCRNLKVAFSVFSGGGLVCIPLSLLLACVPGEKPRQNLLDDAGALFEVVARGLVSQTTDGTRRRI